MCPPEVELNPLLSTSFCALKSSSDRTPKRTPRLFTLNMRTLYGDRIAMARVASNSVDAVPYGQPVTYVWDTSGASSTSS